MTIYVRDHRGDGTSVIVDSSDGADFVLKTGQWPMIASLPNEQQRAALERFDLANKREAQAAAQATAKATEQPN